MKAPGWRDYEGTELYFVDDELFVFSCCQRCGEHILKSADADRLVWTCLHGPPDDKQ